MRLFTARLISALALVAACSPSMPQPDRQAPSAPTRQLAVVQSDGTVLVTWKNPSDGDLARTLLARFLPGGRARKPEGTPAVGDAIGTDGVVRFLGLEERFVDTSPPTTCGVISYRLWSQDTQGHWSDDIALVELPPGATTPPPTQPVSMASAVATGARLSVSWTNPPASSGFFQTTLVRKVGSAPASVTDGATVLTTMGSSFSESTLPYAPGTRLFYGAFTCNTCGRCQATPTVVSFTVPASPDGSVPDAGGPTDAGTTDDGGLSLDAGPGDAGTGADAGTPADAGTSSDAGSTADAGAPVDGGGSGVDGGLAPTALTATLSPDGQRVLLAWVNPLTAGFDRVRVSRTLTETPPGGTATTGAAVQVYEGSAQTANERVDLLLPSATTARSYTYTAVGCSTAGCDGSGASASLVLTLKQALRGGGYTIFWRHASADVCSDRTNLCPGSPPPGQTCAQALAGTANDNWWRTCVSDSPACTTTARQLNVVNAGNETTAVRTWFQTNGVTVGRILSSEYCRCFDTANGFMFPPTLELSQDLTYWVYEESLRCAKTMALLHQTPAMGTVTGMVGHAGNFCPTLDSLAWGEAAIYKPQAPTSRACTTVGSCNADEACVSNLCVKPLLIGKVQALGASGWAALP